MTCVCDQTLQKHTNHCNGLGCNTFWVAHNDFNEQFSTHTVLCVNHTVVFPLNNTDVQCTYNKSGLLCGTCNNRGYSLVLGSSHCKREATNIHLLLLIPFALVGVSLVFLLLVCKLHDSGNRNTQWPSVLCQYCWNLLYHFFYQ